MRVGVFDVKKDIQLVLKLDVSFRLKTKLNNQISMENVPLQISYCVHVKMGILWKRDDYESAITGFS